VVVSSVESEANKKYEGKNIVEIATMRGLADPTDAALDLMAEEDWPWA
jgi:N-acyl-D-aspartate/D-glutamate deacylase